MPLNNFDYPVSWDNFVKMPAKPPGVTEDAEIVLQFPQSYGYSKAKNAVTINDLSVDIGMSLPECWVLTSQLNNTDLLQHEQGHYDITALGAREFYNGLTGMTATTEDKLQKKIIALHDRIQEKINAANTRYDTITNHSLVTAEQKKWDEKIAAVKKNSKGTINDLP